MTAKKISLIVEGEGEEKAAPALINRLLHDHFQRYDIFTNTPKKAKGRNNLITFGGFEYYIDVCLKFDYHVDGILVLLDADDDCPVELAKDFYKRVQRMNIHIPIALVCAKREYEAWFLANIDALIQNGLLKSDVTYHTSKIEEKRDVKGWLSSNMPSGKYKEVTDQLKMTRYIEFERTSDLSRSFRRLTHAVHELIDAIDQQKIVISPSF